VELTNFFEMKIAVASVSKGKLNKTVCRLYCPKQEIYYRDPSSVERVNLE